MALLSHQQHTQRTKQSTHGGPRVIYIFAAIAAIGGLLFGYDSGTIAGAELLLKKDFALTALTEELAISAVLIGGIVGAAISGKLSSAFGRKKTIIILAVLFAIGAVLTALAPNLAFFIAFRILVGISAGIASMVVPVYISEISPPSKRGSLVTFDELAIVGGIPIAYLIDLAFSQAHFSWRLMFGIESILGVVLAIGMIFLPESPRWLGSKGRWEEVGHVLARTAGPGKDQEIHAIRKALATRKHISIRELFFTGLRMALIVGIGLAIFQQVVGTAAVSYYTPTIFKFAGFKSTSLDILATLITSIVSVVATIIAILILDRVSHRLLLFSSLTGMTITLAIIGLCFRIGSSYAPLIVLICLLIYLLAFGLGIGPLFSLTCSEIFPTRLRSGGVSICMVINWIATLVISISFLSLVNFTGKAFTFWIYAVLAIAGLFFCWFLVPETKGKTLEQIEEYWDDGGHWSRHKR